MSRLRSGTGALEEVAKASVEEGLSRSHLVHGRHIEVHIRVIGLGEFLRLIAALLNNLLSIGAIGDGNGLSPT